jgi:hypothetical protein
MWWCGVRRNGQSTVRPRRLRGRGKKEAAVLRTFGRCRARFRVQMGWVGAALCRAAALPGRAGPDKEARRRSRGKLSAGEEGGEGEGADRWGQAEGMTENRKGITEKGRND